MADTGPERPPIARRPPPRNGPANPPRDPENPPRNEPEGSPIARRRLLLALGFGVANLAVIRRLGAAEPEATAAQVPPPEGAKPTGSEPTVPGPTTTEPRPAGPSTTEAGPPEAPVVDASAAVTDPNHVFDTVITGGRVMDPASGFDYPAALGIDGTRITAMAVGADAPPLRGQVRISAAGLVVAPGFIDILSYSPNGYGEWYKVADGVTANLGMHGLDARASDWFAAHPDNSTPLHFGGAYDNATVRPMRGLNPYDTSSAAAVEAIVADAAADLRNGFIGLHMQPEYTPGATTAELRAHGDLAAAHGVPLCVHARYSDNIAPGTNLEGVDELIGVARDTGAHVHIEHITSTGGTGVMDEALGRLSAARSEGLSLTACIYPYQFWATYLRSARFDDWQEKYGISYGDLQVAGTPQRLTEETFDAAFRDNKLTAAFAIPAEDIETALRADFVMVGSDAILERPHNNHPRSTGCFSRLLGHYVRGLGVIDLMTGLSKITIQPARLLEGRCPDLRRKGRLGIGADADITVFDPAMVIDRSTIENPAQRSAGIEWVLVEGTMVKNPAGTVEAARPGRGLRSDIGSA